VANDLKYCLIISSHTNNKQTEKNKPIFAEFNAHLLLPTLVNNDYDVLSISLSQNNRLIFNCNITFNTYLKLVFPYTFQSHSFHFNEISKAQVIHPIF
jgi:hypothetical protein